MNHCRIPKVVSLLLLAASCSHSATTSAATTTNAPAQPSPTSTTRPTVKVNRFSAVQSCGPTDGAWIAIEVELATPQKVFAAISLDGQLFGRSKAALAEADVVVSLGFDPAVEDASDSRLRAVLFSADRSTPTKLAEKAIAPRPPSQGCG